MANGIDLCNGTRFRFGERLTFYSTRRSIFHLMRNLVPLHDQSLAICILVHDNLPRYLRSVHPDSDPDF